jgi:carboxymethylenebutenolidase
MGTRISFSRIDGKRTEGYLAKAGHDHAPGVLVIQEWWGLQDQIKGVCDRLALAGYDALAPDLYEGTVVPYHDHAAANLEMSSLDFQDAVSQNVRGAAQYLAKSNAKVGIVGFCMGGAVSLLAAVFVPEITASISFYGMPPAGAIDVTKLSVPFEGHYSNTDDYITPKMVDDFETELKRAKKQAAFFRYDADHAFMNEQRDVHDRAAAELGWQRMLAFWKAHLS